MRAIVERRLLVVGVAMAALMVCGTARVSAGPVGSQMTAAEIRQALREHTGAAKASAAPDVFCDVRNPDGVSVQQVPAANADWPDVNEGPKPEPYWLVWWTSADVPETVDFIVLPLFKGSPVALQYQRFRTYDSQLLYAQFGVPTFGAGLTEGPWALIVKGGGRSAVCRFEIVAP